MTEPTVHARGLRKSYGAFTAVDGIDFDTRPGECFGFLGPNGAGKTTTMRMVGCASPVGGGTLRVLGLDPVREARSIKARLGVVPQEDNLDLELTASENLLVHARYFGLARARARARAAELLDFVQLSERADADVRTLSGGMKRRLLIARALVAEPEVVILDEPTTGLDPQARHLLWEKLRRLKGRETTLLLTTHYMDEAERLCDRLVIMERGRILDEGSPRELIRRHVAREVVEVRGPRPRRDELLRRCDAGVVAAEQLEESLLLHVDDSAALLHGLTGGETDPSLELHARRATLEDVFLHLTGRSLDE